jgi:hypothetical protein
MVFLPLRIRRYYLRHLLRLHHRAHRKILLLRKVFHKALLNPVNKSRRISMNQILLKDLELGNHQRKGRKPITPISLGLTTYRFITAHLLWALKLATLEYIRMTFHHPLEHKKSYRVISMTRSLRKP